MSDLRGEGARVREGAGIRDLYLSCWQGGGALAPWTADATFVPFDSTSILKGRAAIVRHWRRRLAGIALIDVAWSVSWTRAIGTVTLVAGEQRLVTERRPGGGVEARSQRFFCVADAADGSPALRHVSESPPALLLEVVAAYRRQAVSHV